MPKRRHTRATFCSSAACCKTLHRHAMRRVCSPFFILFPLQANSLKRRAGRVTSVVGFHTFVCVGSAATSSGVARLAPRLAGIPSPPPSGANTSPSKRGSARAEYHIPTVRTSECRSRVSGVGSRLVGPHHHRYGPSYPLRVECADLSVPDHFEGAPMLHRMMTLTVALLGPAWLGPAEAVAQDKTGATWPSPVATRGPVAEKDKKPAPRRTMNGIGRRC